MTSREGYDAYTLYLGIKLHFYSESYDFIKYNGFNECKNAGKLRLEGKDYLVSDGDVMYFRVGS